MASADLVAWITTALLTLALVGIVARVAQLQLSPSPKLVEHVEPRKSVKRDLPLRGDILDRRGRLLATSRVGYRVVVDPERFPSPPDAAIVALAQALNLPAEEVGERIVTRLAINAQRRPALEAAKASLEEPESSLRRRMIDKVEAAVGLSRGSSTNVDRAMDEIDAGGTPPEASNLPSDEPAEPAAELSVADPAAAAEAPPAEASAVEAKSPKLPGLVRYLPIGEIMPEEQADVVRAAIKEHKLTGVWLEPRMVRDYPAGDEIAPILGKTGFDHQGLMGAEKLLEKKLAGTPGSLRYVRDAFGRPLGVEQGDVRPGTPGLDIRLSLDVELQRIATEELARGVEDCNAAGGRLILIDPATGEVLAMVDIVRDLPGLAEFPWEDKPPPPAPRARRGAKAPAAPPTPVEPPKPLVRVTPDQLVGKRFRTIKPDKGRSVHPALARNRVVEDIYEPGSTFKPIVWSTATAMGLARVDDVIDTEGGRWIAPDGRPLSDVVKRVTMTWGDVLVNSSNIGMVKVGAKIPRPDLRDSVLRFGFGRPTGIGLPGEAAGIVTQMKAWSVFTQTSVSYGHEISVTPLQMARAYTAFARAGASAGTLPNLTIQAVGPDYPSRAVETRVLPANIALLTREVMKGVADNMEEKLARATQESSWRYTLFGKSGTAMIPLDTPPPGKRRPRGSRGYYENQYNSSFAAAGPIEDPRLVIVVVIDDPGPERIRTRTHYGTSTAGPVVRRVMERALTYLGVPPSDRPEPAPKGGAATRSAAAGPQRD
ncbi:MAG: penicillin-binding protein 2 [Planctomycetota bacterium]|nr:penicillin-binding protein 2 [Planctomycetota bacterium]